MVGCGYHSNRGKKKKKEVSGGGHHSRTHNWSKSTGLENQYRRGEVLGEQLVNN